MVKLFIGMIDRNYEDRAADATIPAIAVATEAYLVNGNNIEIRKPPYGDNPNDIVYSENHIMIHHEIHPHKFIMKWTTNIPDPHDEAVHSYHVYKIT